MKRISVDHKRCLACKACETACAVEHHPSRDLLAAAGDRRTQVNVRVIAVGSESYPVVCRHCDPADCMSACPAGAISRDARTGAVVIDPARCKACGMCAMVCPFDAISYKITHASPYGRDVAYKCDLCSDRVAAGGEPACVAACHSGALTFGEFEAVRLGRARRTMQTYLFGDEAMPPLMSLYRDLRAAEVAARTGEA